MRSRREELMRNLRWAAEMAMSHEVGKAQLGVGQLLALAESELLDEAQKVFIDAALESVVREPVEEIDEIEEAGELADVVEDSERHATVDSAPAPTTGAAPTGLSWEHEPEQTREGEA